MKAWPAPRPAIWLAAVLVVALDQWTKEWALGALQPGERVSLIGDVLSLQLTRNSGAAFSLGEDFTWLLTIVAAAVTAGIVYYAGRARTKVAVALTGIALGGAVGNLLDRLFREPGFARGHVVDMINYNGYFIGNVADIAIVGAAAAFLVFSLVARRLLVAPADAVAGSDALAGSDATAEDAVDSKQP